MSMSPDELAALLLPVVKDVASLTTYSPAMEIQTPPRYSPSQVRQWRTCPTFWQLSKRWEPRTALWTPHQLVGMAIHIGIAAWLRPQIAGASPVFQATPLSAALATLVDGYHEQETWALEGLQALVTKGYQKLQGFLDDQVLPGAKVVGVEFADPVQDPRLGTERLHRVVDCILERDGQLEVWDWKTKIRLDASYLPDTERAVLHSWQLLDYSWHTEGWFKGSVRHAAQGLVVLGPKLLAKAIPISITPERLTQWHAQALAVWQQMWWEQNGEAPTLMNWEACSDRHLHFGQDCVFIPACHTLCGNESLFSGVFRRKEI